MKAIIIYDDFEFAARAKISSITHHIKRRPASVGGQSLAS